MCVKQLPNAKQTYENAVAWANSIVVEALSTTMTAGSAAAWSRAAVASVIRKSKSSSFSFPDIFISESGESSSSLGEK